MKKYLFFITTAFVAVSSLNAQSLVKVAADTNVRVKESTLFYIGGNVNVAAYTTDNKILNEGNVRVTGNFTTNNNANGNNFVNSGASGGKYGQLIISQTGTVGGKIASQVKYNPAFVYHSLAIPYEGITAKEVVAQSYPSGTDVSSSFVGYNGGGYFDSNRVNNPLFIWDNAGYYLKNLAETDVIDPTAYYALNKGSQIGAFNTSSFTSIQGKPNNAAKNIIINEYSITGNKGVNPVGEYYGSYIIDYTMALPTDWTNYSKDVNDTGFGDNIFNFGNPYTSNIDLSKLGNDFLSKVKTLVQYNKQGYKKDINEGEKSGSVGSAKFTAFVPGTGTGDLGLNYVRPFQTFSVKMNKDFGSATLNFGDNVKTFKSKVNTPNILYNRKENIKGGVNQVGLDLYDVDGNNTGNRVYVVASNVYEASQKGKGAEVYNIAITNDDTAIYTLQEREDGGVDENLIEGKTYINGVNADKYIGKPIHLVFQNGKGNYTIKARLNDDLLNNKNKFYFEDKKNNKTIEINKDFEYSFVVNGTDKDRFVLYWAKKPENVVSKDIAKEEINNTKIYKDNKDVYKVRFDSSIKRANVFVYNISGQLVNVAKGINTTEDYVIPIKGNSSIYIVKVVDDNGKVITKKIRK